jgi:hypothetical protein
VRIAPALALGALLFLPLPARADGAFPDSIAIFAPADRPHRLLLATNFGLLVSDDDGSCSTGASASLVVLLTLVPLAIRRRGAR